MIDKIEAWARDHKYDNIEVTYTLNYEKNGPVKVVGLTLSKIIYGKYQHFKYEGECLEEIYNTHFLASKDNEVENAEDLL